jgi:hypothetical protein
MVALNFKVDSEPVAWRWRSNEENRRWRAGPNRLAETDLAREEDGFEEQALYAAQPQPSADSPILNEIGEAMESRGYAHMTNGRDIGLLLDELERLRTGVRK